MESWQQKFGIVRYEPTFEPGQYWTGKRWSHLRRRAETFNSVIDAVDNCPEDGLVVQGRSDRWFS